VIDITHQPLYPWKGNAVPTKQEEGWGRSRSGWFWRSADLYKQVLKSQIWILLGTWLHVNICLCCAHVYKQRPIKCLCCADLYKHSPTYITVTLRRVQWNLNFAQVRLEYTHYQLHTYIQRNSAEIQTQTHWNLIGCSVTSPLPVLPPGGSILPTWWFHSHKEKFWAQFKNVIISIFVTLLKLCKPETVYLKTVQIRKGLYRQRPIKCLSKGNNSEAWHATECNL
jgi:hypothetical protein